MESLDPEGRSQGYNCSPGYICYPSSLECFLNMIPRALQAPGSSVSLAALSVSSGLLIFLNLVLELLMAQPWNLLFFISLYTLYPDNF